jgi:hypothetical protein
MAAWRARSHVTRVSGFTRSARSINSGRSYCRAKGRDGHFDPNPLVALREGCVYEEPRLDRLKREHCG